MIRLLSPSDYNRGYLDLLKQLTVVGDTWNAAKFQEHVHKMLEFHPWLAVFVYEIEERIVGCITVYIEPKFIHGGRPLAHVEDLVVDRKFRRQGIASRLIEHACHYAKQMECYKVRLVCHKELISVYTKSHFQQVGVEMSKYFRKVLS